VQTRSNLPISRIGEYEIQSLLGRGGMSAVYRGFDTKLQRPVAIKILSDIGDQAEGAGRFRQEALLLASLRHPHIVQVYDFGECAGVPYIVQELLPGPTLEAHLADLRQRGEQVGRDEVFAVVRAMAAALDAAHAAGILHRDVKPANMIRNSAGALVLADFGIARYEHDEHRYTRTGVVVGTPTYLAPEQAQGLPLTPASDIYSLGIVLYELIAGRPPFESPTPMGVVLSHVQHSPPLLRARRPDVPRAVEQVVRRALAKDPAARFASAGALADAIERAWVDDDALAAGAPVQSTTYPRVAASGQPQSRSLLRALAVALTLMLAGGGGLAFRGARQQAGMVGGSAQVPSAVTLLVATATPTAPPTAVPTRQPVAAPTAQPTRVPATIAPPVARPAAPAVQPAAKPVVQPVANPPAPKAAPKPKEQPKAAPKPKEQPKAAPKPKEQPKPKADKGGGKGSGKGGGKKGK
jgi:hypothetical protein